MKKVRKSDIAINTWLGGVCCVPKACLKIDITIIILVKLVIPRINEMAKLLMLTLILIFVMEENIWSDFHFDLHLEPEDHLKVHFPMLYSKKILIK